MTSHFICKKSINLNLQHIDIKYYKSIKHINEGVWNDTTNPKDLFLQYNYLCFLEENPPKDVDFAYVMFYAKTQPIGVAYFQISPFDTAQSIKEKNFITKNFGNILKFNAIVIGNGLLTGEHGYYFSSEIAAEKQAEFMLGAIRKVEEKCEQDGVKIHLHLAKDFFEPQQYLENQQYTSFPFSPNMILHLDKNWKNFDDYLAAMTTKYRTRAKRAAKKLEGIRILELDAEAIEMQKESIYAFYEKIANGADFNYAHISENYFAAKKRFFPEEYRFFAFYERNQLIGFFTILQNHDEMETGFLGLDHQYNESHQLYLNFLYEMVKIAIESGAEKIVFSRTALEIKSSIGAEPFQMHTYMKHTNSFLNLFLPSIVKKVAPKQDWVQRKPFKDGGDL